MVSQRLSEIEYAIREIAAVANKVAKSGKKVFHLNIGDPVIYDFHMPKYISQIFSDKTIKLEIDSERHKGQKNYVKDKEWYPFNDNYGTSEEKACVEFIGMLIDENLSKTYDEIYFVRNELHFKIHNFKDGQAYAPDFVLFLKSSILKPYINL